MIVIFRELSYNHRYEGSAQDKIDKLSHNRMRKVLLTLAFFAVLLAAPVRSQAWSLTETGLRPVAMPAGEALAPVHSADMNGDGIDEEIRLEAGKITLQQAGISLWASPEDWQVQSASLADLNLDGEMELVLLVWRPWQPWPVDRVLPYGGRIADFQNEAGLSCHLILIGWRGQAFGERWAGSALADPLTRFAAADLDDDGRVELAALEGNYADPPGGPARSLTIWKWNGFGFTLVDRQTGRFQNLAVYQRDSAFFLMTTQ
jgi:hypothetical protein